MGLSFSFTEEQELFKKVIKEFAEKEVKPKIKDYEMRGEWPWDIWKKMGDVGILGLPYPKEYGGQEADAVTTGIAAEEIARAGGPYPANIWGTVLATFGSDELKERWIPKVVRGETLIGVGSTEPGGGSDAAGIVTKAYREGDDYIVEGEKQFVSHIKESEAFLVTVRTGEEPRHRGISMLLVELDRPGIEKYYFKTMGWWSHSFGGIRFNKVRVPVTNRVGEENKGFTYLMKAFDFARVLLALWAIGMAEGSLEETMEYVKSRKAFGKPLAKYEAVQFKIAEDFTKLEAAKLLCYRALWLKDQGKDHVKESAMAKYYALKAACETLDDMIQLNGAQGITTEVDHERRYRDVRGIRIGDGTDEIMKIIIARELLGREFLPYR